MLAVRSSLNPARLPGLHRRALTIAPTTLHLSRHLGLTGPGLNLTRQALLTCRHLSGLGLRTLTMACTTTLGLLRHLRLTISALNVLKRRLTGLSLLNLPLLPLIFW